MSEYTRDDLQKELLADNTQYCYYCGQEKRQLGCCGENHFETFAEMPKAQQDEILEQMWRGAR